MLFFTNRSGVIKMSASIISIVCVSEKSRSVFPDLLPCATEVVLRPQKRVQLAFAQFNASCMGVLASFPRIELFVIIAVSILVGS